MTESPSGFTWQVSRTGYVVLEYPANQRPPRPVPASDDDGNPATGFAKTRYQGEMEPCITTSRLAKTRRYRPFDPPYVHLFRRFAETPETPEGVRAFADEFGFLGLYRSSLRHQPFGADRAAEPLTRWYTHIREMREAVRLWDAHLARRSPSFASRSVTALLDFINLRLADRVVQRVSWNASRGEFSSLPEPLNLLGCLWLQLSFAMGRAATYSTCPGCGRVIEKATGRLTGKRKDSKFCSANCRTMVNNKLRSQGIALLRQGVAMKQIGARLGVELDRVKTWKAQIAARQSRGR
jgi:ribosomal protein S27E